MKSVFVLSVLILNAVAKLNFSVENISTNAISDVASELFVRHGIDFDIITLGNPTSDINDTISALLKQYNHSKKVQSFDTYKKSIGQAALVFIDSFSSFLKLFVNDDEEIPKVLFVMPGSYDMKKFFELSSKTEFPQKDEGFFLIEADAKYELGTFEHWTDKDCKIKKFSSLNNFVKNTQKWETSLKIQEIKPLNFHGCPIKMSAYIFRLPTIDLIDVNGYASINPEIAHILDKRNKNEKKILKIFTEVFNFKLIYGELRNQKKEELDVFLSASRQDYPHVCSFSLFSYKYRFMYSPPEPYTNYEKMILPFDDMTWFYLILVFCSAFVGIFVINQTPKVFRDLVYGKDVNMPSFNVIGKLNHSINFISLIAKIHVKQKI